MKKIILFNLFIKFKNFKFFYRYSGITQELLKDVVINLEDIHEKLKKIIFQNTIIIGHSLENDLQALKVLTIFIILKIKITKKKITKFKFFLKEIFNLRLYIKML